jgi:ATP-dependent helicase/nuclease subunit A
MHRLLELGGQAQVAHVAREFMLDDAQARRAHDMARRILEGEGAWVWDASAIDWHANEVPLHHAGELLRIDRLVRRADTGEWWVLDYKSAFNPLVREDLVAQMRRYRDAIAAAHPQSAVRAAFLTAQGKLVAID